MSFNFKNTIVALSTAPGKSAIAVIRMSGEEAINIASKVFQGKDLSIQNSHTIHFGNIINSKKELIDEVVVALYRSPKSFTGENIVEISCHGSPYITQTILGELIEAGATLAVPGEFTQRAFLNGKMDLAQAEAVGDLIASESKSAQQAALHQVKGGFSKELNLLREELINFAALIELELDFSEEDLEFADRSAFKNLIQKIKTKTQKLIDSFQLGNAIKNGINVAIIGKPNVGKSTLLNALLKEDRAIVSDIAGTTRDTIEETLNIKGVLFRLIDTAGIRDNSSDEIENLGIERSKQNAQKAELILYLKDAEEAEVFPWLEQYKEKTITVFTKNDQQDLENESSPESSDNDSISISAKFGIGVENLLDIIYQKAVGESINTEDTIVTNARHHEALLRVMESIVAIEDGMAKNISGDLLAIDIRRALHFLGVITGKIETDRDILGTIFGKFCIGK